MTTAIRELKLTNGKSIFVEVEIRDDIDLPILSKQTDDLPPGAEAAGILGDAINSMNLFQENIRNMAESVYDSLKEMNPDEWTVEMNIGFKGKATPIPFIASGELDGGVKVTATWKREK